MSEKLFPCATELDNSALLPEIKRDCDVKLVRTDADGYLFTPDWFDSLIMVELHAETATPEGTLAALTPTLEHLCALGVNGIWLTPIYAKGANGNGYSNLGPHTLEPSLVKTDDLDEGYRRVAEFIHRAHELRIRVFLDIITWGTLDESELFAAHPDWYKGNAWGGEAFDWESEELREWFIETCISLILKTGADGFRCDCEPMYSGYRVFAEIRTRLLALGKKIAVIAEESSERRATYDCEQDGITGWIDWSRGQQYAAPRAYFLEGESLVDCIRSGKLHGDAKAQREGTSGRNKYYTYCVSNHDFRCSFTNLNRLKLAYQAIFAPYIPLWYHGEQFGMKSEGKVIYFVPVDTELLDIPENREFCADVARYIRIRRSFPEIFEHFPLDHREANIVKLESDTAIESYARFAKGKAVLVVPRIDEERERFTVELELAEFGFAFADNVRLSVLTGGEAESLSVAGGRLTFTAKVDRRESVGVYLLEDLR